MTSIGQYEHKQSPVHNCDPRVKLLAVLGLGTVTLKLDITGLFAVLTIFLFVSLTARIGWGTLIRSTRPAWPFFIILFLVHFLFTPGKPIFPHVWGPLQISYEGLNLGIIQVGRFLLLVLAGSLLTLTTMPSELTLGLERLLRPLQMIGISSNHIALMVNLALRFIPELQREKQIIREAGMARGADFQKGSISGNIRAIVALSTPLTLSVLRRSDVLAEAMEARGWHPGPRTALNELKFTARDRRIMLSAALVIGLLWYLN